MKYEAIEQKSAEFDVKKMCKVLNVKAPNYYRWKKNKVNKGEKLKEELEDIKLIEKIFEASDKIYGYRKINKELKKKGKIISEYRVRRIMRENGLYPETTRKYKPTHNGKKTDNTTKTWLSKSLKSERETKFG